MAFANRKDKACPTCGAMFGQRKVFKQPEPMVPLRLVEGIRDAFVRRSVVGEAAVAVAIDAAIRAAREGEREVNDWKQCSNCEGSGLVARWGYYGGEMPYGMVSAYPRDVPCDSFPDDGEPHPCGACKGTGQIVFMKAREGER